MTDPENENTCPDCGCPTPEGLRCDDCRQGFAREVARLNSDLRDDPINPLEER